MTSIWLLAGSLLLVAAAVGAWIRVECPGCLGGTFHEVESAMVMSCGLCAERTKVPLWKAFSNR